MKPIPLALALIASLACSGACAGASFVRSYTASNQTYLDQFNPMVTHNGASPMWLNVSDAGASQWPLLRFVVPALNAGETFDSARVVVYGAGGSLKGQTAIYGHGVLRAVIYSQASYNVYATGQAWATAGAWGVGDCDVTTNYGYGANGHFYEMTTPTDTVQDSLTIARGAGFKTFTVDWVLGKTVDLIWHSLAAGPGSLSWPYGVSTVATLTVYGHTATADMRRRRVMVRDGSGLE